MTFISKTPSVYLKCIHNSNSYSVMHKITTCARHLTHQDSWISWQVLWCLYLYRFFLSRYDSDAMFFSSRQYARVSNTHTHTPSLMYYQLFVPYRWYTEIKPYSDYIHLVRAVLLALSCYTKRFITCYRMLSIYILDASNDELFCVQHIILGLPVFIYTYVFLMNEW